MPMKSARSAGSPEAATPQAEWIFRARIVSPSWKGLRTARIAEELGCHPKTVRKRLHRFNAEGIDGLGDRPGAGRSPASPRTSAPGSSPWSANDPPGKLLIGSDGGSASTTRRGQPTGPWIPSPRPHRGMGIEVGRSQVRRILLAEGVRWRNTRPWAESADPEFVPKGPRSSGSTPTRRPTPRWSAWTSSAPSALGSSLRPPAGRRTGTASRRRWNTVVARIRRGCSARCESRTASRSPSSRARGTPEGYIKLLKKIERAIPQGIIHVIADNLKTHKSAHGQGVAGETSQYRACVSSRMGRRG